MTASDLNAMSDEQRFFDPAELAKLYRPTGGIKHEGNGQLTIIGGSKLFHGAPILSLKVASRIVDMVFFSSPENSVGDVAAQIKSSLLSFIWVPWDEVEQYILKSDAVLIGPGFMRYGSEKMPHGAKFHDCDEACQITRDSTSYLLQKFPRTRWVIDGGSLQVIEPEWIPKGAIVTPNKKEMELMFKVQDATMKDKLAELMAQKYECVIVAKDDGVLVSDGKKTVSIPGGNPGLSKGGMGDVMAGLIAALFTKNDAFLSACCGSYLSTKAADALYKAMGANYNSDDLAQKIPEVMEERNI